MNKTLVVNPNKYSKSVYLSELGIIHAKFNGYLPTEDEVLRGKEFPVDGRVRLDRNYNWDPLDNLLKKVGYKQDNPLIL